MNRLSSWIVRRPAPPRLRAFGGRSGQASAAAIALPFHSTDPAGWLDDLKLFATGWVGGLIFFGTLIG